MDSTSIFNKLDSIPTRSNEVSKAILDAAYRVHTNLGPGLLECIYETCLTYELRKNGFIVETQFVIPIKYEDITLESGLRLDMLVDGRVIVEIKTVDEFAPIHQAQLLSYLKLTGYRIGLLINFKTYHLKDGIKRVVL